MTCAGLGWESTQAGAKRCACLRASVMRRKLAVIPSKFAGLTLNSIVADAQRHPDQAEVLAAMRAEPQASYVLCGRNGSGKTQLGWLLYRAAVEREQAAVGVLTSELLRQFREWQVNDVMPVITPEDLRSGERRFLLLDELDKAKPSEFAAEQLFALIDAAYAHRHQLVITSNTPLDGLSAHWSRGGVTIGPSIVRRLMEMDDAVLVEMF